MSSTSTLVKKTAPISSKLMKCLIWAHLMAIRVASRCSTFTRCMICCCWAGCWDAAPACSNSCSLATYNDHRASRSLSDMLLICRRTTYFDTHEWHHLSNDAVHLCCFRTWTVTRQTWQVQQATNCCHAKDSQKNRISLLTSAGFHKITWLIQSRLYALRWFDLHQFCITHAQTTNAHSETDLYITFSSLRVQICLRYDLHYFASEWGEPSFAWQYTCSGFSFKSLPAWMVNCRLPS